MEREGKHSLYDLSQQIHSTGEKKKKETILLEADVDTASLSKMERVHPVVAVTKGLMGLKVPVMGHLSSCGRTAEAACNPK